jgi:hypothetical protein
LEKSIFKLAVDSSIHRNIIMNKDVLKGYFPNGVGEERAAVATIGNLYYNPAHNLQTGAQPTIDTFNAYKHNRSEITLIQFVIKILFGQRPVWVYEDLWNAVRSPPVNLEVNPRLFDENNFILALSNLVAPVSNVIPVKQVELTPNVLLDKLFDYSERYIYQRGGKYKIEQVDKYYVLFPVLERSDSAIDKVEKIYSEISRDKELTMVKSIVEPNERAVADADSFFRKPEMPSGVSVDIDNYVRESRDVVNYTLKKSEFIAGAPESVERFVLTGGVQFQINMAMEAIVTVNTQTNAGLPMEIATGILRILKAYDAIITADEVRKYKDVSRQFTELPPGDTPIGIMHARSLKIYDIARGSWTEISKVTMNRQIQYKENEIIVGIVDDTAEGMRFRLRRPKHIIQHVMQEAVRGRVSSSASHSSRVVNADVRFVDRGIVCSTKSKTELMKIMRDLGISSKAKDDLRVKRLCSLIREDLIASELKERSKRSKYKYVYFWWDDAPRASAYL